MVSADIKDTNDVLQTGLKYDPTKTKKPANYKASKSGIKKQQQLSPNEHNMKETKINDEADHEPIKRVGSLPIGMLVSYFFTL